jgi:imidazolonepropionase-like amidohydrolase
MRYVDELPAIQAGKLSQVAVHSRKVYKLAIQSGVKIAIGTDQAASVDGTYNSHGKNGKKIL